MQMQTSAPKTKKNKKTTEAANKDWRQLRTMSAEIPKQAIWSGCLGLAAYPKNADRVTVIELAGDVVLVPIEEMSWLVMLDIPPGNWLEKPYLCRRYTAVTEMSIEAGALRLTLNKPSKTWDHWNLPAGRSEREFAIANRTLKAMLTYGRTFRAPWKAKAAVFAALGQGIYFGEEQNLVTADAVPRFEEAFFRPYAELSSRATVPRLLSGATTSIRGVSQLNASVMEAFVSALEAGLPIRSKVQGEYVGSCPTPSYGNMTAAQESLCHWQGFLTQTNGLSSQHKIPLVTGHGMLHIKPGDKVRVGDEIGFATAELPTGWRELSGYAAKYYSLPRFGVSTVMRDLLLHHWLESQIERCPASGKRFIPYELVAAAATREGSNQTLMERAWLNVVVPTNCWNDKVNGYILPALRQPRWNKFRFTHCGVDMDLQPRDPRFIVTK